MVFDIFNLKKFTLFMFKDNRSDLLTQFYLKSGVKSTSEELYSTLWNSRIYDTQQISDSLSFTDLIVSLSQSSQLSVFENSIRDFITQFSSIQTTADELFQLFPEYRDELEFFEVLTYSTDGSLYHRLSIPDTKMYYPEPYVASPSFVHDEIWFIHILHYQHWLWFFFISLILLYFVTFINVVRWCNPRNTPKRETRGVSRSKCADLITATVPVSWATSIIISESVDAVDYYDGFGTSQLLVGIRAYQWGWFYYYPKNAEPTFVINPSYTNMLANSLKYSSTSEVNLQNNHMWKFTQLQDQNNISTTPAHLLLAPQANTKILNFINFKRSGLSTLDNSSAFKKIQFASKINSANLFSTLDDFSLRYAELSNIYCNDSNLINVSRYGIERQHNLLSAKTTNNNLNTFLGKTSLDKLMSYNLNGSTKQHPNIKDTNHSCGGGFSKNSLLFMYPTRQNFTYFLTKDNMMTNFTNFLNLKDSSKHKFAYNTLFFNDLSGNALKDSGLSNTHSSLVSPHSYTFEIVKSGASKLLSTEKNIRNLQQLTPTQQYRMGDIHSRELQNQFNALPIYMSSFYQNSNFKSLNLLTGDSTAAPSSTLPMYSPTLHYNLLSYGRFFENGATPNIFTNKEDVALPFVFNTYWRSTLAHNLNRSSYQLNWDLFKRLTHLYFPNIHEYDEYDFKNKFALELLEDIFWESNYSAENHEEYINNWNLMMDYSNFEKEVKKFNLSTRNKQFRDNLVLKPLMRTNSYSNNYTASFFTEDNFLPTELITLGKFKPLLGDVVIDTMDESFDQLKAINYIHNNYVGNVEFFLKSTTPYFSYNHVIDSFRADFDEQTWFSEDDNYRTNIQNNEDISGGLVSAQFSNFIKLRSTAKNSIVTYNAIQKVFRSRFDEGRSNTKLDFLSNSSLKYLFLTDSKVPYEKILGKNKINFFGVDSYNHSLLLNISPLTLLENFNNIYFIDIPFLLSKMSDASRYLWFDWHTKWNSIEVQPSSITRYSLYGVPYSNKNFIFATSESDEINESETYLMRLVKARKNYNTSWGLTPYFYTKVSNWYKYNMTNTLLSAPNKLLALRLNLQQAEGLFLTNTSNLLTSSTIQLSNSGIYTPGRAFGKVSAHDFKNYYNYSTLIDILSKREYLYREYLLRKSNVVNLPSYLVSSPSNILLQEVQKSINSCNIVTMNSELSRYFYYLNLPYFYSTSLQDLSLTKLNTILTYLLPSSNNSYELNTYAYRNQYRFMRKGITSMVRLQATGAIALPTEVRLHILASSKDVIHSWAIPSAGIKIDCIPGYSSHRIMVFLVNGIFWGQCMEICGRFHHWMPIIVYFMKRDLFFLWCTHFVHYSLTENRFNATNYNSLFNFTNVKFDNIFY